jgi:hypothetical protein
MSPAERLTAISPVPDDESGDTSDELARSQVLPSYAAITGARPSAVDVGVGNNPNVGTAARAMD